MVADDEKKRHPRAKRLMITAEGGRSNGHRLCSFISIKPSRTYRTIVQLITATTADTGLTVRPEMDENKILGTSRCPTRRWPSRISRIMGSTATGIIRSHPLEKTTPSRVSNQLTELFMDAPLEKGRYNAPANSPR